jgi:hypothetical protein
LPAEPGLLFRQISFSSDLVNIVSKEWLFPSGEEFEGSNWRSGGSRPREKGFPCRFRARDGETGNGFVRTRVITIHNLNIRWFTFGSLLSVRHVREFFTSDDKNAKIISFNEGTIYITDLNRC